MNVGRHSAKAHGNVNTIIAMFNMADLGNLRKVGNIKKNILKSFFPILYIEEILVLYILW